MHIDAMFLVFLLQSWYEELLKDEESFVDMLQYSLDLNYQAALKKNGDQVADCLVGNYRNLNKD